MIGPVLCPKCKGLHFRNAPCIVRNPKLEETKCNTTGTLKPTTTTSSGANLTVGIGPASQQDKRGRGRPRTITDMRSYKAAKQREYRERKKNERDS